MNKYNHEKIEKKWQKIWDKAKIWQAPKLARKKKFYPLIEFPYPSGAGLHIGHIRPITAMDIIAHKRRAEGYDVLYPIGWDASGLPTENYAIKMKMTPQKVTKINTDNFRKQLKRIGFSFDWSREINTMDPEYYKWTQWIFLQLYKHGLAYKARIAINWCPVDKIGLANEEVINGECERCGATVEKREKEQWMLAITKYAERLYNDLDHVDYLEKIKTQQRNWIGKSEGAEIDFAILDSAEKIKVFTTRPDTLFGATYMVLAPEHTLVATLSSRIQNKKEVELYIKHSSKKSEIDRTNDTKEKTGVRLEGVWAINPANQEKIPIYIADYVLAHYGTGAIMAVPAHDERDYAFAKKFNLPIVEVIEPETGEKMPDEQFRSSIVAIVEDPNTHKLLTLNWGDKLGGTLFVGGGREEGEDAVTTARREITEETGYINFELVSQTGTLHHHYFAFSKNVARNTKVVGLYFKLTDSAQINTSHEVDENNAFTLEWLTHSEVIKKMHDENHLVVFQQLYLQKIHTSSGILTNSGTFSGMNSMEAKKKITEHVGGKMVTTYKLRDWVFSRQRYWGEPIPMIFCEQCAQPKNGGQGWQPVPEKDLPVKLPTVKKYEPTDDGESPLSTMDKWLKVRCPKCNAWARRETDTMPNWAGSSWYYLRYADSKNKKEFASKQALKSWTPVDWYNGGMEHTTLHLLYSRFWHKFLYDLKLVPTSEPYIKRTSHGLILAEGGVKMSKSKGNTISPDDIAREVGADTLRMYEMFMGPFSEAIAWNTNNMVGMRRFLDRVWKLQDTVQKKDVSEINLALHTCIKKVSGDIEEMKFNTAVSAMMVLVNEIEKKGVGSKQFGLFLRILAPFAPHIAEELWHILGNKKSIHLEKWPKTNEKYLVVSEVTIVVSINGKPREQFRAALDTDETTIIQIAKTEAASRLLDYEIIRTIYVPNKLVNFVIKAQKSM